MKHLLQASFLGAALVLGFANVASAQRNCTEGVAANGECVNAPLVKAMRQDAVIFSQPKISYTAYPILPTIDDLFRYPNQLNPNQQPPAATGHE